MNNVEEESVMDIDAIMLGLDNLYNAGYYDCKKERDYDPRGKGEWQGLMDMFKQSMKNNNPISNKSKPLTEREIRILSTLHPNKLSYEDVELIVRRVEYLHDIGL